LIYNEIVVVPVSFMKIGSKKELEKKKKIYDEVLTAYDERS